MAQSNNSLSISVVIPAYNEEENLKKNVLFNIKNYLENQSFNYEVVIVDDGSKDNTYEILTKTIKDWKNTRVINNIHCGKAFSLIKGATEAKGDYILFMDMDQATPIEELDKFLQYIKQNYDIVVGSRGIIRKNAPLGRKILSTGQILVRDIILGFKGIKDTQCGFKLYKSTSLKKILEKLYIFNPSKVKQINFPAVSSGFDLEVLFVATKLKMKIIEVPVLWDYKMSRRVNLFKDALRGLNELLQLKFLDIQGKYN